MTRSSDRRPSFTLCSWLHERTNSPGVPMAAMNVRCASDPSCTDDVPIDHHVARHLRDGRRDAGVHAHWDVVLPLDLVTDVILAARIRGVERLQRLVRDA